MTWKLETWYTKLCSKAYYDQSMQWDIARNRSVSSSCIFCYLATSPEYKTNTEYRSFLTLLGIHCWVFIYVAMAYCTVLKIFAILIVVFNCTHNKLTTDPSWLIYIKKDLHICYGSTLMANVDQPHVLHRLFQCTKDHWKICLQKTSFKMKSIRNQLEINQKSIRNISFHQPCYSLHFLLSGEVERIININVGAEFKINLTFTQFNLDKSLMECAYDTLSVSQLLQIYHQICPISNNMCI